MWCWSPHCFCYSPLPTAASALATLGGGRPAQASRKPQHPNQKVALRIRINTKREKKKGRGGVAFGVRMRACSCSYAACCTCIMKGAFLGCEVAVFFWSVLVFKLTTTWPITNTKHQNTQAHCQSQTPSFLSFRFLLSLSLATFRSLGQELA